MPPPLILHFWLLFPRVPAPLKFRLSEVPFSLPLLNCRRTPTFVVGVKIPRPIAFKLPNALLRFQNSFIFISFLSLQPFFYLRKGFFSRPSPDFFLGCCASSSRRPFRPLSGPSVAPKTRPLGSVFGATFPVRFPEISFIRDLS